MKQQLNLFLHALQFYSRIPAGKIDYTEENLAQSVRYFPLIGSIVGAVGGSVFMLSMLVFSQAISVTAAIISSTKTAFPTFSTGSAEPARRNASWRS